MSKHLHDQIHAATEKLARLKARELLASQREAAKKREQTRKQDAHRKIELGGLVIAADATDLDPAELVGILLTYLGTRTPEKTEHYRKQGLDHLEARKALRSSR